MIKGIFQSEASMRPKMARLDAIANNLANVNSAGFKRDRLFVQVLKDSAQAQARGNGDLDGMEVRQYVDLSDGPMEQTGNPFDLAIQGRGFFAVQTPEGTRYTRNGSFTLAQDGSVVTGEGYPVLGTSGPLRIPDADRHQQGVVRVTETGEVTIDRDIVGRFRVVDFENPGRLKKDRHAYFRGDEAGPPIDPPGATIVRQGFLEGSNVEGIEELIALVELNRSFETDQRIIASQDAAIDRALDVGRV